MSEQRRPDWCPYQTCLFRRSAHDVVCGGELRVPVTHDETPNTHRVCFRGADSSGGIVPLMVNANDLDWFRFIFDALDGKKSSWLSQRAASPSVGAAPETPEKK